jgi:hypothetical protein
MRRFSLWQRWLFVVGLIMSAFGVLLALFNATPLFALFDRQINPVFWGTVDIPGEARDFQKWVYGVLGATLAGWGVFLAFIAHHPFKQKEKWAWNCILAGLLVWFIIDTTISLNFKVYFNAAFNTALFAAVALPLWFSRKHFAQP